MPHQGWRTASPRGMTIPTLGSKEMIRFGVEQGAWDEHLESWTKEHLLVLGPLEHVFMGELRGWVQARRRELGGSAIKMPWKVFCDWL